MKSAHDALRTIRQNCYAKDWVIDMDISKFFDEVDHEVMLKAVAHILPDESWVLMYVKRWLEMPVKELTGEIVGKNGKGTPQGGVISPILANLYLHYTLDKWLSIKYPQVSFVRYADDVVIHCNTEEEAILILEAVKVRLSEVKLSVKESKTKIAYCKDYRRKEKHENVKFEFLGFSFQPTPMKSKRDEGKLYTGYGGKISPKNEERITAIIREEESFRNTHLEIKDIAIKMNAKIRGWYNYYSLFNTYDLLRLLSKVDDRLIKWISNKYRLSYLKAIRKLKMIKQEDPTLFYHWKMEIGYKL